jgi:H+/Na+-translocating ferredoxin:NAD+ oxidoreductase subunit B
MFTAVAVLLGLTGGLSLVLVVVARLTQRSDAGLVELIESQLPRIQCGQCGYPGCRPYAAAIATGAAPINRCPPGGAATITSLAELLGEVPAPLDVSLGTASIENIAVIDEEACIGCNLCARACPVDAIVGVAHTMHTVIAAHCTGCELCLSPCPVDCIALVSRD